MGSTEERFRWWIWFSWVFVGLLYPPPDWKVLLWGQKSSPKDYLSVVVSVRFFFSGYFDGMEYLQQFLDQLTSFVGNPKTGPQLGPCFSMPGTPLLKTLHKAAPPGDKGRRKTWCGNCCNVILQAESAWELVYICPQHRCSSVFHLQVFTSGELVLLQQNAGHIRSQSAPAHSNFQWKEFP